jgi:twinkle protein
MVSNTQVDDAIAKKYGSVSSYTQMTPPNGEGQSRSTCPKCSAYRKKKTQKCLSINHNTTEYFCHNPDCGIKGMIQSKDLNIVVPKSVPKTYKKPRTLAPVEKTDKVLVNEWLIGRGIDAKNLPKGLVGAGKMYLRDIEREDLCVIFNYNEGGLLKNRKGRRIAEKQWAFSAGAELIPYNADAIRTAADEKSYLLITEGEIDALSWLSANVLNTISCPNGTKNMHWLDKYMELFEEIPEVYIAYDNDKAGREAIKVLTGRFGADKVKIVKYPEGQDANQMLMEQGWESLRHIYADAENPPVEGLSSVNDHRDTAFEYLVNGYPTTYKTGISQDFDDAWTFYQPEVTLVTAPPSSGKSALVEAICTELSKRFGFRFGFLSGEKPVPMHIKGMAHKYARFDVRDKMDQATATEALNFLNEHLCYYTGKVNKIDDILDVATSMVKRYGISGFVIDNWSVLEDSPKAGSNSHELVGQLLNKCQAWAKKHFCHLFIVAHPKKMEMLGDNYKMANGYDVSGSSHFFNLVDNGISLRRTQSEMDEHVDCRTWKIRNQEFVGSTRDWELDFSMKDGGNYTERNLFDEPQQDTFQPTAPIDNKIETRKIEPQIFDELGFD